jgi:catechol-2,3-dioxygenase
MAVTRMNHAVLYVRDAPASARFYSEALGLEPVNEYGSQAVFLRAPGSANDHDLGLFSVGAPSHDAPSAPRPGLYHLAWEVPTLGDLQETAARLREMGSLVGASDHGASRSLYAKDPDGIEFEVMWQVPVELMGPDDREASTRPLDLLGDIERFGPETKARVH